MKIKKGFELRDVCGEPVVVAHGLENIDFSKIVSMNESAAYLWKELLEREFTAQDMIDKICEHYDVDAETARHDVSLLIAQWTEIGLLE